jgi:hypothetical protein
VTGFFKTRRYQRDGETKEYRELVVTSARLEKMKVREQARLIRPSPPGRLRCPGGHPLIHSEGVKTAVEKGRPSATAPISPPIPGGQPAARVFPVSGDAGRCCFPLGGEALGPRSRRLRPAWR